MFDNFGLGEFFFLAILALLFFGPERLPQIGAQMGRWISRLTQYSKSFMNEWREEALAIHDAVAEVRGIRDEIAAARAEISSTLDTARGDLTDGIDAAKEAVSGARIDVTDRLTLQQQQAAEDLERIAREERGEATPDEEGEDVALARTQEILDDLRKKRAATASETAPAAPDADVPEEDEWHEIHQLIEAGMSPATRAPEQDTSPVSKDGDQAFPDEVESEAVPSEQAMVADPSVPGEEEPVVPKETAFERSQKILEDLKNRRAGINNQELPAAEMAEAASGDGIVVDAAAESPQPPRETAFERSQKILDDLSKRRAGTKEEAASAPEVVEDVDVVAEAAPEPPKESAFSRTQRILDDLADRRRTRQVATREGIQPAQFEELSAQVVRLQNEIAYLRRELESLRILSTQRAPGQDALSASDEVSVEEAA